MNNPEANFMSPMSGGPPAGKKLRAGATPRPFASTATSRGRGPQGGPPPAPGTLAPSAAGGRGGPPPVITATATSIGNRSTACFTDRSAAEEATDGVARRKAELRRMQEQRQRMTQRSTERTNELAASGPPIPPPMQPAEVGRHLSDLFPTVPKAPSPALPGIGPLNPAIHASTSAASAAGPPRSTAPIPPTPAVNRKLEFPSSQTTRMMTAGAGSGSAKSRSKSAPPVRPPPPPPPKKETGDSSGTAPKTTLSSARPDDVFPGTLAKASTSTPKSAGGGLPPTGTSTPSVNIPFSRISERAASRTAKKSSYDNGPTSPHLIQSSKTVLAIPSIVVPPVLEKMTEDTTSKPVAPPMMMAVKTPGGTLAQETVNVPPFQTPAPPPSENPDTPPSSGSSTRREKIQMLRAAAGEAAAMSNLQSKESTADATVAPPLVSETQKRLEEAYAKAEQEKREALKQIKELEEKLSKAFSMPTQGTVSGDDTGSSAQALEHLLRLADEKGPHAAVEWAKTTASSAAVSFSLSSMTPIRRAGSGTFPMSMAMESPVRRRVANRAATPAPKRTLGWAADGSTSTKLSGTEMEKQLIQFFKEAAQTIPFEYTSDLATYCVRRPYGLETAAELMGVVSPMTHGDYSKRAHVSTMATIEVAVTILADHSLFLLFDVAGVRYKTNRNAKEWKIVSNVDDYDRPLGNVMYIDEQANECEYSLDSIFEEALLVRQHYCSTMTSMAISLEQRPPAAPVERTQPPKKQQQPIGIPESVQFTDTTSGAEDKSSPPPPVAETNKTVQVAASPADKSALPSPSSGRHDDPASTTGSSSSSGSADVLIVFIGMLFSTFAGFVYFLFIGLPLRVIQNTFITFAVYSIISMLYMFAAQDYNDWLLQNIQGSVTANDLVFFSNHRPGIM
jgi:hypothetical protein